MRAVFRPGLGQRLQLNIGWLASLLAIMLLNGSHLVQIQREQTSPTDLHQLFIAHICERNGGHRRFRAWLSLFRWQHMSMRCISSGMSDVQLILLNHWIVQKGLSNGTYIDLTQTAIEYIAPSRLHLRQSRNPQHLCARHNALGQRIGHAWMKEHIYSMFSRRVRSWPGFLHHAIGQQLLCKLIELRDAEVTGKEVKLGCT